MNAPTPPWSPHSEVPTGWGSPPTQHSYPHPRAFPPPVPGPPTGRGGPPVWVWVVIALGLVVILVAATAAWTLTRPDPQGDAEERSEVLTSATADLRTWEGVTYRGRFSPIGSGPMDAEVTVDRNGTLRGTLTRPAGGRAEFAQVGSDTVLRGDRNWWRGEEPDTIGRMADVWVKNPSGSARLSGLESSFPNPLALVERVGPGNSTTWIDDEPAVLDGVPARAFSSFSDRVVVDTAATPPRIPAWSTRLGRDGGDGLRPRRAEPAALDATRAAPDLVAATQGYFERLIERPVEQPRVQLLREPQAEQCRTPTCTLTVRVLNRGTQPASGQVEFAIAGRTIGLRSYTVAAGESATVTATTSNPAVESRSSGVFPWFVRLVP